MAHMSLADLSRMPKMAEKPKKWVPKSAKSEDRGKMREKSDKSGESTRPFAEKSKRHALMYDHARSRKD